MLVFNLAKLQTNKCEVGEFLNVSNVKNLLLKN